MIFRRLLSHPELFFSLGAILSMLLFSPQIQVEPQKLIQSTDAKLRLKWYEKHLAMKERGVYKTIDGGETWENVFYINQKIGAIDLVMNPQDSNVLYASMWNRIRRRWSDPKPGPDDGRVHLSRDGGHNWTEIMKGLPYKKHVSRLAASSYDEGRVYLALNGKRDDDFAAYLFKSVDYGQTWVDIANNIPYGPINVVKEDPKNERVLYIGTDLGVYVTIDGGETWHVLGSNLPSSFVHDLVVHPRDNVLIAAPMAGGCGLSMSSPRFRITQKRRSESFFIR